MPEFLRFVLTPWAIAADLLLVSPVLGAPDCPCEHAMELTHLVNDKPS